MAQCPKCNGQMTPGYVYSPDTGGRVKWIDGERSLWRTLATGLGMGPPSSEVSSHRCSACGFIEFFTDTGAKPVKTLSSVEAEASELRELMKVLQDRVGVLETIATDPAERTAREIEALRDTPDSK
ncbi:PF20097 family protein [Aurantiacibacter sp. D1-12]|uniref:PF20097 family protein n=1 Tax=Aurantiacibacter sp. D1-12 TaxID=2993658 RepID=UPI00237CAEF9|nr:PF20097 family protein [Aurantiacibacter sp. D1-12]MDE1467900.1 PF20097 family protein [Aurantiacibacter sp. D1-12]